MHSLRSNKQEARVDNDPLQEVDYSYNVQQLQAEFHVLPPSEAYRELCFRHQCKPINSVANLFSSCVGEWNVTTHLDFSQSYIGPKGVRPVVELCKRLPALKSFNCANNYLTNNAVYFISRMAAFHPSLERLELSFNEFISWTGGNFLYELTLCNSNIKEVGVLHTKIPPNVAEEIFRQSRCNCVLVYQAMGRPPKQSSHPEAIHLRAMKRFFNDMQENGTVPASALVEGHRERCRILGEAYDASKYTKAFYDELSSRLPQDNISWEAFIITLKLDGSVYNEEAVKKLRRLFLEFNMEPTAELDGFVEVRDLPAMCTRLNNEHAPSTVIKNMCDVLGLDDTMTLQWDEFLSLMYNSVATNMEHGVNLRMVSPHSAVKMLHL